jgi:SAM-dependent methyltransferase
MHDASKIVMTEMMGAWPEKTAKVLDVGSLDINGTYRPLIEGLHFEYTGLDLQPGKNVDLVANSPYSFPVENDAYDIVISGSTMEHVELPWVWLPELVRVLRPGGMLAIVTHWHMRLHRYPKDYWRFMPDGIETLFNLTGQLEDYWIWMTSPTDVAGMAWKKKGT